MMSCYIYLTPAAYNLEKPDVELEAFSVRRDGDYLMIEDKDGYSHIVNLIDVFSVTYK